MGDEVTEPPADSILTTMKKLLYLHAEDTTFDTDIMIHINSVFSRLQQLGVGPKAAFEITGASERWSDFIGDTPNINEVRSYMYLRVRILFDPPDTSHAREAFIKQATEMEWRLNVQVEGTT